MSVIAGLKYKCIQGKACKGQSIERYMGPVDGEIIMVGGNPKYCIDAHQTKGGITGHGMKILCFKKTHSGYGGSSGYCSNTGRLVKPVFDHEATEIEGVLYVWFGGRQGYAV